MATMITPKTSNFTFLISFKSTFTSNPHFSIPPRTTKKPFSIRCSRDPPPEIHKFWDWLSNKGIISAKCPLKPAIVSQGLGLIALKDIAKNEVVLEVPEKFWINPDTVAASQIGSVCNGLKPWVSVALFLITEKKIADLLV
ncbi:unnamed protein product [Amaranthus hypochondriacus]